MDACPRGENDDDDDDGDAGTRTGLLEEVRMHLTK